MMSFVNFKHLLTTGILFFILIEQGDFVQIPTYEHVCNKTISLFNDIGAGKLVYTYYPEYCSIVIETDPGSRIGYAFIETSAFWSIYSIDDQIFYTCTSYLIHAGESELKYGCTNSNYTDKLQTTLGNKLKINVLADTMTNFKFELVFFSYHDGPCYGDEMSCTLMFESNLEMHSESYTTACMDYNLKNDKNFDFCYSKNLDYDIGIEDKPINGSLIVAVVLLCIIIVPLLILSGCLILRKYCKKTEPDLEDIPTRARRPFAEIVAEAHENAGYDTGPLDSSKFDPPPEYGSLEHLDDVSNGEWSTQKDKRLNEISIVCPPSYGDVMKHSDEYLVSNYI